MFQDQLFLRNKAKNRKAAEQKESIAHVPMPTGDFFFFDRKLNKTTGLDAVFDITLHILVFTHLLGLHQNLRKY